MTVPDFRPYGEIADGLVTAEHGHRLVRNGLWSLNERAGVTGVGFLADRRTLWRASATWGYLGPFLWHAPASGTSARTVRLMVRGVVGTAPVTLYAVNQQGAPTEAEMDTQRVAGDPTPPSAYRVIPEGEFNVALTVPVFPGPNRLWLGVRSELGEPFGLNSPAYVQTTPINVVISVDGRFLTHPALRHNLTPSPALRPDESAPFRYILVDDVDLYTVPATLYGPDDTGPAYDLLWERSDLPLRSESVAGDAVKGPLGLVAIAGIAIDPTDDHELENQAAQLRYTLLPAASGIRSAVFRADAARRARLPVYGFCQLLRGNVAPTVAPGNGTPGLWASVAVDGSWTTIRTQSVGVATSITGVQESPAGVPMAFEASCALAFSREARVEFRLARIVSASDDAVDEAGDVIGDDVAQPTAGNLARTIDWSALFSSAGGCVYGCEGMSKRNEWAGWNVYTLRVAAGDGALPRVALQARVTLGSPVRVTAGPMLVRLTEGA